MIKLEKQIKKDKAFRDIEGNMFCGIIACMKNALTDACLGDYIFQIDADEMPSKYLMQYLPILLETNDVEVLRVPRINTVKDLTQEHIQKWGWVVDNHGRDVRVWGRGCPWSRCFAVKTKDVGLAIVGVAVQADDATRGLEVTRPESCPEDAATDGDVGHAQLHGEVDDADPALRHGVGFVAVQSFGGFADRAVGRQGAVDVSLMALSGVGLELMGHALEESASG